MAKRTLLFNFFASWETIDDPMNEIHFKCLEHYFHVFDEVIFVITLDNITDYTLIHRVEDRILPLHTKGNITFKIKENNNFRESDTFYNEFATKLDNYDLVLFGHNKGIANVSRGEDRLNIYLWVIAMYYFNLNFIDEMEQLLIGGISISYGPLAYYNINADDNWAMIIKYKWWYAGTFFWTNCAKLKKYLNANNLSIPKLDSRFYDECFLGNLMPIGHCTGHNLTYQYGFTNLYSNALNGIKHFYGEEEFISFKNFFNTIASDDYKLN